MNKNMFNEYSHRNNITNKLMLSLETKNSKRTHVSSIVKKNDCEKVECSKKISTKYVGKIILDLLNARKSEIRMAEFAIDNKDFIIIERTPIYYKIARQVLARIIVEKE